VCHEWAFQAIKDLVTGAGCLTTIDHQNPSDDKIFVTMDMSDLWAGAVLSWGKMWEMARPVAFDSLQLCEAELNYPVHKKELLVVVHALQKWWVDLIREEFEVHMDHKTLLNFNTQKDLSCQQGLITVLIRLALRQGGRQISSRCAIETQK
jgi:hypothetical protein